MKSNVLESEPLFKTRPEKLSVFPINPEFAHLYTQYKKLEANYWVVGEIDFQGDVKDWEVLDNDTKIFIESTLAFFAGGDTIVGEGANKLYDIFENHPEIKAFYAYQIYNETVHGETYSLLIEHLIQNSDKKQHLFNSFKTMPHIKKLYDWAKKWVNYNIEDELLSNPQLNPENKEDRDLAFIHATYKFICAQAAFECIGFASSFASIFWIKEMGILKALAQSNFLISKDESAHFTFAVSILKMFVNKPANSIILEMIKELVEASQEFMSVSIDRLNGLNCQMMCDYIEFVADTLLMRLGMPKYYKKQLPVAMSFMNKLNFNDMNNMFEQKGTNYGLASVAINNDTNTLIDEDF
jgi:ribonucleoside-diphosphate reductase subunit M2